MRFFLFLSGLGILAAGATGCGGGPCADYCQASLECATSTSCELADEGKAKSLCTDACEKGVDAVPDSEGQAAIRECLGCLAPLYKDSCDLSEDQILQCQSECIDAIEPLQIWVETFGQELEGEQILCKDGTPVGGGNCSYSNSRDGTTTSCGVECSSGDSMAGAECQSTGGETTCQCTMGANQGQSFQSTCDALDSNVVWDVCN